MTAIRTFLARAVPWPTAQQPGFVNIHWTNRDKATRAKRGLAGRAFTDHGEASNYAQWIGSTHTDVYVCMSLQADAEAPKLNSKKKPFRKALRGYHEALLLRSFWIDIDVKPGAFATTVEAKAAFDKWRILVGLPEPTFIVLTGSGGFHVHWVLDDPVSRETWLPLARALQNALMTHQFPCDYGVVVNPVCILRVPDTQNFKDLAHVTDVTLDQALNHTYPLSRIEQALDPYRVAYASPVTAPTQKRLGFKPNPKFAGLAMPKLDAGIEAWVPTIDDVADVCPWIDATLNHGGQGYSEPLWFESLKVASFVVDGEDVAHELSWGHVGYDDAATEQKYEQVAGTHGGGRIGWPQCRTINAAGAMECATCPHFPHDRSPLNYVSPPPAPAAQPTSAPQPAPGAAPPPPPPQPAVSALRVANPALPNFGFGDLPPHHVYATDGIVNAEVEVNDPADPSKKITVYEPVLAVPIFDLKNHRMSVTGQGFNGVSFTCQTDATNMDQVVLRLEDMMEPRSLKTSLAKQNVPCLNPTLFQRCTMSFRSNLRNIKQTMQNSEAFGWSMEKGGSVPTGFCYGGVRHSAGPPSRYVAVDKEIGEMYSPMGSLDYWKQAAALITGQNRADLNTVVAAAFAGPLVYWTGHSGMVLSVFSNASGIGKSHAMRIAQSVWANPQAAMSALDDTGNYVGERIAVLRHLPFFYDELRQADDTKKLVGMVFAMGQGKSKGRLNSNAESRKVHTFSTLMAVASNTSLMSYINDHVSTTAAGINRIFEMEIATVPDAPGMIDPTVAQAINGGLNTNCGVAGEVYARALGRNVAKVQADVQSTTQAVHRDLGASHDERFWVSLIAVLILGASYSNQLGLTTIDMAGLQKHLYAQFNKNRRFRVGSTVDIDQPDNALRFLQDYINVRRDSTMVTNKVWLQQGRPPQAFLDTVQILNSSADFEHKLVIRVAKDDQLLRVSMYDFGTWLKKDRQVPRDQVLEALIKATGAVRLKASISMNTKKAMAREDCLEFDLSKFPDLFG